MGIYFSGNEVTVALQPKIYTNSINASNVEPVTEIDDNPTEESPVLVDDVNTGMKYVLIANGVSLSDDSFVVSIENPEWVQINDEYTYKFEYQDSSISSRSLCNALYMIGNTMHSLPTSISDNVVSIFTNDNTIDNITIIINN